VPFYQPALHLRHEAQRSEAPSDGSTVIFRHSCHCEGVLCPKQSPGNWETAYLETRKEIASAAPRASLGVTLSPPRNDKGQVI